MVLDRTRLASGWPALAALSVVALGVVAWPFTVDDAFIVARYAESVALRGEWAMNPGVPSDGVTGPLWVLPMAAAIACGVDPLLVAKMFGLAAGALAAFLVVRAAGARAGGRTARVVTALAVGLSPELATWSQAGLSTGVAALLATVIGLGVCARPAPHAVRVGVAIAALAGLRPELALFAAAALGVLALRDRRAFVIALSIASIGAVAVAGARLAAFGDPLPLSFHAKPGDPGQGLAYAVSGAIVTTGGGVLLLGVAAFGARRPDPRLVAMLAAHLLAVVLAGGDWMPGFRLLVVVLPLYALLLGRTAADFSRSTRRSRRLATAGLVALALVVPLVDLGVTLPRARQAGEAREREGRALADVLRARARVVALVDVGYLAWASGVEVVDLGGVTDSTVAHAEGGHLEKHLDLGYLASRDPDAVVLHSATPPAYDEQGRLTALAGFPVERALARSAWLRVHYRVSRVFSYSPEYHYAVLVRRDPRVEDVGAR